MYNKLVCYEPANISGRPVYSGCCRYIGKVKELADYNNRKDARCRGETVVLESEINSFVNETPTEWACSDHRSQLLLIRHSTPYVHALPSD